MTLQLRDTGETCLTWSGNVEPDYTDIQPAGVSYSQLACKEAGEAPPLHPTACLGHEALVQLQFGFISQRNTKGPFFSPWNCSHLPSGLGTLSDWWSLKAWTCRPVAAHPYTLLLLTFPRLREFGAATAMSLLPLSPLQSVLLPGLTPSCLCRWSLRRGM